MTTQHTPSEWHTNSGQVYSLDDTRGATIALVSDHYGPDVQQANARLIAAAPDLLAALTELTEWMKSNGLHQTTPAGRGIFRTEPVEYSIYTDAIAAIAKAQGE